MRDILLICILGIFSTAIFSQDQQPRFVGIAGWHSVPHQKPAEKLRTRAVKVTLSPTQIPQEKKTIQQRKIDPGSRILKKGPTLPFIQSVRFAGRKLDPPIVSEAPSLFTRDNAEYNLSYTDNEHGFAGSNTTDFAEDANHAIWMASAKSLIRYDGYYYYRYTQKTGLPDMTIESIAYDNQERLWLASDKGAYFIKGDSIYSISSTDLDFSRLYCRKVQMDRYNRIWLSTKEQGAICIEGALMKVYDKRCGLPYSYVQTTYVDEKGAIYIGLSEHGVILIQPDRLWQLFDKSPQMQYHHILAIYEDKEAVWLGGFSAGLIKLGKKDTVQYTIAGNYQDRIWDIKKAPDGLWLSIYGRGLYYWGKNDSFEIMRGNGLNNESCYNLFQDSFENLWIASISNGFSRLNENSFYLQPFPKNGMRYVTDYLPDGNQGRWVLSDGNALGYETSSGFTKFNYKYKNGVNPLQFPRNGVLTEGDSIWITSYGDGIIYGKVPNMTIYHYSDFYENEITIGALKDNRNRIWYSTLQFGLIAVDKENFFHYTQASGLLSNAPENIFLDNEGALCCAFNNGLQRIGKSGIEVFRIGKNNFTSQVIATLVTKNNNTLWGTEDDGLFILFDDKAYQLTDKNGLLSNKVKTLIQDKKGAIWITTEKSIESFELDGHVVKNHKIYNQTNGTFLLNLGAAFLNEEGHPYWSARNRVLVFDPLFMRSKPKSPFISLQKIMIDTQVVASKHAVSMLPDQKLSISVSCIYFGRENNLKMDYYLVSDRGDTTLRSFGNRGNILISDILPGKYRIIISARDNTLHFLTPLLSFDIRNFWYNTWLFRLGLACCIVGMIILYFRRKAARQDAIKLLLEKKVTEQTEEILKEKVALEKSYRIIDKQVTEKDALIQEINHRVKNNLQYISAMVQMQINTDEKKDTIQSLHTTSRRLTAMSLVHEMLYDNQDNSGLSIKKYIMELAANLKEMAINPKNPVVFWIDIIDIVLDSKTATALGIIISELVSNSLKHAFDGTQSPEVTIRLTRENEDGTLRLLVADNGRSQKKNGEIKEGLGTRLVDIFSRQLEGDYTMDTNKGYTYIVRFKPQQI